jgi:hypothetical protein
MINFIADFGHFIKERMNDIKNLRDKIYKNMNNNDLLLLGGDNFYPNGLINNDDIKLIYFKTIFNEYNENIYGILGNHDYHQCIKPQMNNNYFKIPNYYYKISHDEFDIFMIDTTILDPNICTDISDVYRNINPDNYQNIKDLPYIDKLKIMRSEISQLRRKILDYLDNELNISNINNKIKIVCGHYNLLSYGYYVNIFNNNNIIIKHLLPLFIKHRVNIYLCGHDHTNQHIVFSENDNKSLLDNFKYDTDDDIEFITKIKNEIVDYNTTIHQFICGTAIDSYNHILYNNINNSMSIYKDYKHNCYINISTKISNSIIVKFINTENNTDIYSIRIY